MAYSYAQILESQYESIDSEQSQAVADLEAARLAEDAWRTTNAANRILELDKTREALDRRAQGFVASQQAAQQGGNRFGLSETERSVAHNSFTAYDMTKEQKEELYARNRQKYQHMKATGQYSVDQGRVFK